MKHSRDSTEFIRGDSLCYNTAQFYTVRQNKAYKYSLIGQFMGLFCLSTFTREAVVILLALSLHLYCGSSCDCVYINSKISALS